MVKSGVLGLLFSAYSLVAGQAQQRTRSSNATVASSASIHAAFEPPVQIGSSNLTKFWFSRLGATGHHDTLVAPAQRGGDGSALPCRAHDGCSGKLFTTVDGGSSWNPAGPTGLSSINPDEGEFIAIIPRNEPAGSFLTLGYEQTLSPDGLSTTGCADNRLWADKGAGKLQVLRAANVTITGFPQPLRGIVFNPRPVLLPDGEWLAPLYGTFRDPPLGCNASSSGECSSVFFARSVDAGMGERWQYASHIDRSADWMPWVDSEGPCEPSVVLLPDGRLMTAMRVDARSMLFHAFSDDGGSNWVNISRMPAWAVMPQLQLLSNGILVLSSGRPGLKLWARPTAGGLADDNSWTVFDLALEHNARVDPRWKFSGHTLNSTCVGGSATACGHGDTTCTMCSPASDPPETTAYTGLSELTRPPPAILSPSGRGRDTVSRVLVVYDRLANGWQEPPGPWGTSDALFSMSVSLSQQEL